MATTQDVILEVKNLVVRYFPGGDQSPEVKAVEEVSFDLRRGEALGLVGESGCGKTTLGLALMRLLPASARIVSGDILFHGKSLPSLPEDAMNRVRWKRISMAFQGAMSALNPVARVMDQVAEPIRVHENVSRHDAAARARELLSRVGIPEKRIDAYPHEFSGGMLQRAVLAMALACRPEVIIADEPGTALDVVMQAQVLALLRSLQEEYRLTTLIVSHDLSAIGFLTDRCAVMYAGRIVEMGSTYQVLGQPRHPYTQALLQSYPQLSDEDHELRSIPGSPPNLANTPPGCPFHPRCPYAMDICREEVPTLRAAGTGHVARCVLVPEDAAHSDPAGGTQPPAGKRAGGVHG